MRRYQVEIPTAEYWRRQIKCQDACPVHTDARGYVRAVAEGNEELAYLIARGPNPLASICGRVCGAPCEAACRRSDYDEAISIRALKQYLCGEFGAEARSEGGKGLIEFIKNASPLYATERCMAREELLPLLQSLSEAGIPAVEEKSVGVIGAGPAGLAAAHDLALLGFSVTIYEMESLLGGMLAVGIPHYRLPRDLIAAEVETILELGVKPVTDCCVGRDVSLAELRERHDAVIIAVGAKRSRKSPYPGSDAEGVFGGVEFLRDVALGEASPLGRRVVVVGGGDAAMDSARTALRVPGQEEDDAGEQGEHQLAMDAARTASRAGGREINIVYRRSRAEMPAVQSEIREAAEEGVRFHLLTNPVRIEKGDDNKVRGVWCEKMELGEPDESGRRRPVAVEGSEFFIECDNVLIAIGQAFDLSFIDPDRDGLAVNDWGQIDCDPLSGATSAEDVFVAGDLAHGAKLLIHAVASGKAVARTIYEKLTGRRVTIEAADLHFPLPTYDREPGYEKQPRLDPQTVPLDERFVEANRPTELSFTVRQARCEAGRCFDCGVNTIFEGQRCVLCGGCVDVCPENCLRIVSLDEMAGDAALEEVASASLGDFPLQEASAIIKDETVCIRCGLCAQRCPTGAITMERLSFEEKPRCRTK
jgi:NADPH-dependent glutamate synthase beta subunit-like oxidoreductase/ferredoxin